MTLLFTALILVFAFAVQSAFGFGVALLSVPMLSMVLPITQITPLLAMLSVLLSITILRSNWSLINRDISWRLLTAASVGVPFGISFLVLVDEALVKIVLGSVVVLAGINALQSLQPVVAMPAFAPWPLGFVIGVLGGAYNLQGAPLVLCLQWARLKHDEFRATIHGVSLILNLIIIASYGASGLLSKSTLVNFTAALPTMIIGSLLGNVLFKTVNADQFKKIVYYLLVTMGASLIVSGLNALLADKI